MSRAVKQQKVVGLDPRKNLITPLDAIPLIGGAKKVGQGASLIRKGVPVIGGSYKVGLNYIRTSRFGIGQILVGTKAITNIELGATAIIRGSDLILTGVTGGMAGYHLVHKNSITLANLLDPKEKSRGRGPSLTSKLMTPRHKTTSLSNRGGDPSQSKGRVANARGRARRKTSYCNLHKKYDFCEYYKK